MSRNVPNWNLLPNNPLEFFGLAPGFDRKELKRAYGKLIKQFKPESHPAEFQKIREAYEVLESQNRYGVQQALMSQLSSAWNITTDRNIPHASNTDQESVAAEVVNDFDAAIAQPLATYKRLARGSNRSPQDFYILATLSDLVDSHSENMYVKWLLTGVNEHPGDPGLLRLLTEYLAAFAESNIACSTLLTLSKLIEGSDFYRVTERLWDRLLDELPFATFSKTLDGCEGNLKSRNLRPRLAFYTHLLRKAIWKAPAEWIDVRLRYIEQHGSEIDASLDEEVEFVNLLRNYYQTDRSTLLKKPLGSAIDRMIKAYCCDSSLQGMGEIAGICDELARNGNGVMQTFAVSDDESGNRVLFLCSIIAQAVAVDTGLDFGTAGNNKVESQADAVVADFQKSIQDVAGRLNWMRYRHFGVPILVLWLGPLILLFGWQYWWMLFFIWTLLVILIHFAVICPLYLNRRADEKTRRFLELEYAKQWRPRLYRYVQASHLPARQSITQLMQSAKDLGQSRLVEIVLSYAFEDRSLHLFSQLQLFVH
jgi:hypothetical protein